MVTVTMGICCIADAADTQQLDSAAADAVAGRDNL